MRRILAALAAIVMIASLATDAASQCSITHTVVQGGGDRLCAVGGSEWEWSGPGAFTANTECVAVSTSGTYTLRVFDGLNGIWSAPCSYDLVLAPGCPISGPDSVCASATVTWCGPAGYERYNWIGPNGPIGQAQCVVLSEPGDYTLDYADANGNGDICTRSLSLGTCAAPPSRERSGCPLTSREWSHSCGSRAPLVDAATFAAVASRVDQRSAVWSFGSSSDGLCQLLRRDGRKGEREWACRQYATILANIAAGDLGVMASDGRQVGLDPGAPIDGVRGIPAGTTLANWVERTEATMLAASAQGSRQRATRDEYRRITRQARAIMRTAVGCGTTLAAELEDDGAGVLGGSTVAPTSAGGISTTSQGNPLTGARRLRWTLERAGDVRLDIVDVTGRRVRQLAAGMYGAGTHEFTWDGRDDDGRTLRAGAYFVVGRVGSERTSARLFLLR